MPLTRVSVPYAAFSTTETVSPTATQLKWASGSIADAARWGAVSAAPAAVASVVMGLADAATFTAALALASPAFTAAEAAASASPAFASASQHSPLLLRDPELGLRARALGGGLARGLGGL